MSDIERPEPAEGVQIIHRDDQLLVVAKAAGVVAHPAGSPEVPSLAELLNEPVWMVHRLDRETSGVLVLARSEEVAAQLSRSFAERRIEKRYLALVGGVPHEKGIVRRPLLEHGRRYEALTRFRRLAVLKAGLRCSLLQVRPATGRPHQIRRHLAGIGHPLLGDDRHGDRRLNAMAASTLQLHRLFLHAASLTIPHPLDGQKRTFTAGLPEELIAVLELLDAPGRIFQRWVREPAAPPALGFEVEVEGG